jgi:hypothetical protein
MPMFRSLQRLDESFDEHERAVVERYLRGATEAMRAVTDPPSDPPSDPPAGPPSDGPA